MSKRSTAAIVFALALAFSPHALAAEATRCDAHKAFAVVAHGGVISKPTEDEGRLAAMKQALTKARAALSKGAASLDVVETIVRSFEDSGIFNAGRGAIVNAGGFAEVDASIMDGRTLSSGAVASMTGIKNPVTAARLVMEESPHVLMVGDRGEIYVKSLGAESVSPGYFVKNKKQAAEPPHGTVGAVALDRCGHIAAATSTGGFGVKVPGRVGDSPIVGAGVYANDEVGGFSATGHGEIFIRFSIAKDVADRMQYGGQSIDEAMKAGIKDRLTAMKEEGALIGIDRDGHVVTMWSGTGLFRGFATESEAPVVALHEGPTASKPRH